VSQEKISALPASRPTATALAAAYFFYAAVLLRTPSIGAIRPFLPAYMALELLYLILFTLVLWRPPHRRLIRHLYFVFQSLLVLFLLILHPGFDFIINLFVLLSYQAALVFAGRERWGWVVIQILLIGVPLMISLGPAQGLAVSLLSMAVGIVFPAYAVVTQEIELSRGKRELLLAELQESNLQLTAYAGQVEELSAVQERYRLARELHDSVSQTMFSIALHSRATRILLERDPERLRPQLEQLQVLTQEALAEMRSLIAELRPQAIDPSGRPTP
jgi:signal transduction histidine kinase